MIMKKLISWLLLAIIIALMTLMENAEGGVPFCCLYRPECCNRKFARDVTKP
ncbi:hypothetical protein SESBI_22724 [Sesbania bispinosa]|nr:hypothetical protein SESBI_22724 [Sesbania bispinosa]